MEKTHASVSFLVCGKTIQFVCIAIRMWCVAALNRAAFFGAWLVVYGRALFYCAKTFYFIEEETQMNKFKKPLAMLLCAAMSGKNYQKRQSFFDKLKEKFK